MGIADRRTEAAVIPGLPRGGEGAERAPLSAGLLAALALLSAFTPIAMDLYLPAFPQMAQDLAVGSGQIQQTMTAFLVGACVGQFAFGPLSDRLGRRGPLLAGTALAVLASAGAALSPEIDLLILARFLQGLTSAAGMVIGRAVIADRAVGRDAARGFTLVTTVNAVVPVLAPFTGSLVLGLGGWRAVLGVIAVVAAMTLAAVVVQVPESLPLSRRAHRRAPDGQARDGDRPRALTSRQYLTHMLCFVFAFATLMAYISSSSFLYQDVMGWSPVEYGLLFGMNGLVMTIVSIWAMRRMRVTEPARLLDAGLAVLATGAAGLLAVAVVGVDPRWLMVPLIVVVASLGLVMGSSTSIALAAAPHSSGSASAVLGGVQFGMAAVISWLLAVTSSEARPLAVIVFATAVIALLLRRAGAREAGAVGRRAASDPS
ncbi:MAG: multidrug effflux MFS transporter [Actinomyces sp.]|jgi:DHA1 family bicyclomycin/chloramphenicol resistance-like MFS transporter|nr:multidrug effflux MFS transporter [Actinomyces sp.]MCI1663188.1 multidrug effflux MFS transporter [Actinomyces sp.]